MKQIFTLLFLIISFSVFSQQVVKSGLKSYYPFNGTSEDVVGQHDAKVQGADLSTDRFGNPNNAYELDGIDDIITFGDTTGKALQGNYTISLWVYNDNDQSKKDKSTLEMPKGWHHIVITSDKSGKSYFYFDNKMIDSSRAGSKPTLFGNSAFISGNKDNGKPFKGKMDDIRIYQRQLSKLEVDSLFNEPNPVKPEDVVTPPFSTTLKEFSIFPNPAKNKIYISGYLDFTRIEILDVLGKRQREVMGTSKELNISDLKSGLYLVRLYNNEELIGIKKFVIEK